MANSFAPLHPASFSVFAKNYWISFALDEFCVSVLSLSHRVLRRFFSTKLVVVPIYDIPDAHGTRDARAFWIIREISMFSSGPRLNLDLRWVFQWVCAHASPSVTFSNWINITIYDRTVVICSNTSTFCDGFSNRNPLFWNRKWKEKKFWQKDAERAQKLRTARNNYTHSIEEENENKFKRQMTMRKRCALICRALCTHWTYPSLSSNRRVLATDNDSLQIPHSSSPNVNKWFSSVEMKIMRISISYRI